MIADAPPRIPVIEAHLTIDRPHHSVAVSPCDDNGPVHCNGDLDLRSFHSRVKIILRIENPGVRFYVPFRERTCLLFSDPPPGPRTPFLKHGVHPGAPEEHEFRNPVTGCGQRVVRFVYFNESRTSPESVYGFYFLGPNYYTSVDPSIKNDNNYQ